MWPETSAPPSTEGCSDALLSALVWDLHMQIRPYPLKNMYLAEISCFLFSLFLSDSCGQKAAAIWRQKSLRGPSSTASQSPALGWKTNTATGLQPRSFPRPADGQQPSIGWKETSSNPATRDPGCLGPAPEYSVAIGDGYTLPASSRESNPLPSISKLTKMKGSKSLPNSPMKRSVSASAASPAHPSDSAALNADHRGYSLEQSSSLSDSEELGYSSKHGYPIGDPQRTRYHQGNVYMEVGEQEPALEIETVL